MKRSSNIKHQRSNIRFILLIVCSLLIVSCSLFLVFWWSRGWDGKESVNVVVSSGDALWVLAIRPEDRAVSEIELAPTTTITFVDGNKWQARALWGLSQIQKNPRTIDAAGWDLLEVPVDFSFHFPAWEHAKTSYFQVLSVPFIRIPEAFRLISFLHVLREDRFATIHLSELSCARKVVDPSGTEIIEVDRELLAPLVQGWFEMGKMREQPMDVAIRNARGITGYGAKLARQLEHLGIRVISVQDGEGDQRLVVKSKEISKSLLAKRLSTWYRLPIEIGEFDERAGILLVQ